MLIDNETAEAFKIVSVLKSVPIYSQLNRAQDQPHFIGR